MIGHHNIFNRPLGNNRSLQITLVTCTWHCASKGSFTFYITLILTILTPYTPLQESICFKQLPRLDLWREIVSGLLKIKNIEFELLKPRVKLWNTQNIRLCQVGLHQLVACKTLTRHLRRVLRVSTVEWQGIYKNILPTNCVLAPLNGATVFWTF